MGASAQFDLAGDLLSPAGFARLDSHDAWSPLDDPHCRSARRPLVSNGPYRFLSHPNYFAVIGEIAILPLCLGLPLVALVFSVGNAVILMIRVQSENAALSGLRSRSSSIPPPPRRISDKFAGSLVRASRPSSRTVLRNVYGGPS